MTTTKKTVALLSTSALAAGAAHGAILYTNVNITLSEHGALSLDLNQDGTPDFQLAFNASAAAKPYITNAPPILTTPAVLSAGSTQGLPVTTSGTTINGSYEQPPSRWDILTKMMPRPPPWWGVGRRREMLRVMSG